MFPSLKVAVAELSAATIHGMVDSQFDIVRHTLLMSGSIHLDTRLQDACRDDIIDTVVQNLCIQHCIGPRGSGRDFDAHCLCLNIRYRLARQMITRFSPWTIRSLNPVSLAGSFAQQCMSFACKFFGFIGKQAKFRCETVDSSL